MDLGPFISKDQSLPFSLCSAPVMFHIEHDPSILSEINEGLDSVQNVDYAKASDLIASIIYFIYFCSIFFCNTMYSNFREGKLTFFSFIQVYEMVIKGPGIELTKQLQKEHSQRAMEVLSVFQESDARTALSNIIAAMRDF